jgi:hypothetical protein
MNFVLRVSYVTNPALHFFIDRRPAPRRSSVFSRPACCFSVNELPEQIIRQSPFPDSCVIDIFIQGLIAREHPESAGSLSLSTVKLLLE